MVYTITHRAKRHSVDDTTSQADALLRLPVGSKLPSFERGSTVKNIN